MGHHVVHVETLLWVHVLSSYPFHNFVIELVTESEREFHVEDLLVVLVCMVVISVGISNGGHPSKLPLTIKIQNVFCILSQILTVSVKSELYLTGKLAHDGHLPVKFHPWLERTTAPNM